MTFAFEHAIFSTLIVRPTLRGGLIRGSAYTRVYTVVVFKAAVVSKLCLKSNFHDILRLPLHALYIIKIENVIKLHVSRL